MARLFNNYSKGFLYAPSSGFAIGATVPGSLSLIGFCAFSRISLPMSVLLVGVSVEATFVAEREIVLCASSIDTQKARDQSKDDDNKSDYFLPATHLVHACIIAFLSAMYIATYPHTL